MSSQLCFVSSAKKWISEVNNATILYFNACTHCTLLNNPAFMLMRFKIKFHLIHLKYWFAENICPTFYNEPSLNSKIVRLQAQHKLNVLQKHSCLESPLEKISSVALQCHHTSYIRQHRTYVLLLLLLLLLLVMMLPLRRYARPLRNQFLSLQDTV